MMASHESSSRPLPPRTTSRFAPGVYFNLEWGVALKATDKPTHIRGVNFTTRRMQERFAREDERHRARQLDRTPLPISDHPHPSEYSFDHNPNWDYRQSQQERQRERDARPYERHSRGSSAPPSFERDDFVSPVSPLSPEQSIMRPRVHASTFPRETLDRPLPYTPANFRLGEDELPWSTPLWYWPTEPDQTVDSARPSPTLSRTSPALQYVRRHSASQISIASRSSGHSRLSLSGGLPSLGYESSKPQTRRSPIRRVAVPTRAEDPRRVHELGNLHTAMIGVDGLEIRDEPLSSWIWDEEAAAVPKSRRSLGWAVKTEPIPSLGPEPRRSVSATGYDDFGYYEHERRVSVEPEPLTTDQQFASHMHAPPAFLDSSWNAAGRSMARPRSSNDGLGYGFHYWG